MGSFATTCAVSGLPIGAGNKVRFMLLCGGQYNTERPCYMHDMWFPRTYPLTGQYNDYGSVENYQSGRQRDIWLEGLQHDLAEIGWGDNRYHDPPALKSMTFEQLLEALWAGRVKVDQNPHINSPEVQVEKALGSLTIKRKSKPYKFPLPVVEEPVGLPTLNSVMKLLTDNGFKIYGHGSGEAYMVDEEQRGSVRIRWSGYVDGVENLSKLLPILEPSYAAMITCGTGNYADQGEIIVRPRHDAKRPDGGRISLWRDYPRPTLSLAMCMIREDVWQALVGIGMMMEQGTADVVDVWRTRKADAITIGQAVRNAWDVGEEDLMEAMLRTSRNWHGVDHDGKFNPGNYGLGPLSLGNHWEMMREGKISTAERDSFLTMVSDFLYVQNALLMTRYWWHPSYIVGGQCGEWALHATVLNSFGAIAKTIGDAYAKDAKEWDEKWAAELAAQAARKKAKRKAKRKISQSPAKKKRTSKKKASVNCICDRVGPEENGCTAHTKRVAKR